MKNIQQSQIQLSNGDKLNLVHNLPEFGLSIDDAFQNWIVRTNVFTVENFCEYIMSKSPAIIAMPYEKFKELKKINS